MENVIHINTTKNKDKAPPKTTGEVVDFTVPLIRKQEAMAQDEWNKEFIKAIEASQNHWKANQVSVRDMEIRFLEQLQQELKEYGLELLEIQDQLAKTTDKLERKILWKHMKVVQDKMDAARRGIAIKRHNIERMT